MSRVPCGQTDGQANMTKLIVAFSNFADATKKLKEKELGTRDIDGIILSW